MVKGISRQVIVVQSPEPKLFDQAIFILKEDALADGISDDALLREAKTILQSHRPDSVNRRIRDFGFTFLGAIAVALIWCLSFLL